MLAAAAGGMLAPALWVLYRTAGAFVGLSVPPWLNRWPLWQQIAVAFAVLMGSAAWAAYLTMRERGQREFDPGFAPPSDPVEPPRGPYDSPRAR